MNVPYVKQYDSNGVLTNPIVGIYKNLSNNRASRRSFKKKTRFHGESKNFHLTVTRTEKYVRFRQIILLKDKVTGLFTGEKKIIEQYAKR